MSLKDLAQQMKSRGRNGDTELIHMTKGEVAGLQQLAEAAGGTLTRNPDTGLPEAFYLRGILPGVLGLALAPVTGGASAAMLGAGAGALLNPDDPLVGAAMGGFGALGGHGLGTGLSAAGAGAAGGAMGSVAPTEIAASLGAKAVGPGSSAAMLAAQNAGMGTEALASYGNALNAAPLASTAAPTTFSNMGQGIQSLFSNPSDALQAMGGGMNVAKNVGMGAAPLLYDYLMPQSMSAEMPGEEEDDEDLMGRYEYRANPTGGTRPAGAPFTSEARYFDPEFRPRFTAAQGGAVKKFADGGEASASSSDFDPARGMTGTSADAMRFLSGAQEQSPALQARMATAERLAMSPTLSSQQQAPQRINSFGGAMDHMFTKFFDAPGRNLPASVEPVFRSVFGVPRQSASTPMFRQVDAGYTFDPQSQTYAKRYEYVPYTPPRTRSRSGIFGSAGINGFAEGGIASLAKGGMKAGGFVVPADVVSMAGEGNTEAGYEQIKRTLPGATPIKGKDGGQADTVKTSIEGKQPARVAHGEMYVPPETVKKAGGAKKLYAMMDKVREQATGNKKQIKPVNIKKALA